MNDLAVFSIPFIAALMFFAVWLYQLRQQEAARYAARRERARQSRSEDARTAPETEPITT